MASYTPTTHHEERFPRQWPVFWSTTMVDAAVTYVTTLLAAVLSFGGLSVGDLLLNEELREEVGIFALGTKVLTPVFCTANHEAELKLGYMRLRWEKEQESRGKGGMLWLTDAEYNAGERMFLDAAAMKPYMQSQADYLNDDFLAEALGSFSLT
ncbi:hypothetical protein VTL71DRAFT_9752 [Oculimacula yallundae]|uniref:Uncharacterized protein n=1 Tax=Oculimacula yallundae TaxID=86028 RepID=A0ABR4BRQ5_9HELO